MLMQGECDKNPKYMVGVDDQTVTKGFCRLSCGFCAPDTPPGSIRPPALSRALPFFLSFLPFFFLCFFSSFFLRSFSIFFLSFLRSFFLSSFCRVRGWEQEVVTV